MKHIADLFVYGQIFFNNPFMQYYDWMVKSGILEKKQKHFFLHSIIHIIPVLY